MAIERIRRFKDQISTANLKFALFYFTFTHKHHTERSIFDFPVAQSIAFRFHDQEKRRWDVWAKKFFELYKEVCISEDESRKIRFLQSIDQLSESEKVVILEMIFRFWKDVINDDQADYILYKSLFRDVWHDAPDTLDSQQHIYHLHASDDSIPKAVLIELLPYLKYVEQPKTSAIKDIPQMDESTIQTLTGINQRFYEQVAGAFDQTRKQQWQGWNQLLIEAKKQLTTEKSFSVLDVGCGNGRFGTFLKDNGFQFSYVGVDQNETLLSEARKRNPEGQFAQKNILNLDWKADGRKFDVIVLFGVMHHIPSFHRRQMLIESLMERLNPGGALVFTAWQFMERGHMHNKTVPWNSVPDISGSLDLDQLEPGDYLLKWERGSLAYRYCHELKRSEVGAMIEPVKPKKADYFYADGKPHGMETLGKSNLYVILEK